MCGIAGIADVTGRPVDGSLLRAMSAVQAHRGPDGEGIVCRGAAGLGHRRLAIIDLATGDQPMVSDDGAIRIVFNGEIYNFRELRQELESRGARFTTTSDTEVILRAYEAEGPACVARLRGMFAFAILDERARRLVLARDRAGIKDALGDYLTYHYVPAPRTIFSAIRKLPPASTLVLPLDGGEPIVSRYWTLRLVPDLRQTEEHWIERLRTELADAVRCHMISDVPIGAFLSGGVDSSTVVALMAQASSAPIRTFSIGFDEAAFDELRFARQVAARYGTDHYELVVKPNALDVLPKLAWHFDEPFADSSAIPTYYVSKITREHVTVALSGDGGDENFAGYRRYARALALHERLDGGLGRFARPLCRLASALLPIGAPGQAWAGMLGAGPFERYFRMVTYQRSETLRRLLSDDLSALARSAADPAVFSRLASEAGAPDYVSALQRIDIATYLPGDILAKVDRTSMAVSLESRVPLLDHRLMELVATIPSALKLRGGTGKYLLKRAMAADLPPEILTRRKMGFGVPLGAWFRHELRDMARDVLLGSRARQRGIFRVSEVEALLATHDTGRRDYSARLWSLICFELWMRQWVDRGPAAARETP